MIRAVALALVLLAAQQIALAHAVSHVDGQPKQEGQQRLCELHSAMGAVLGAADTAPVPAGLEDAARTRFCGLIAGEPGLAAPTPHSRGPPRISRK